MKRTRNIMCLLLAVLAIFVLVACGESKTEENANGNVGNIELPEQTSKQENNTDDLQEQSPLVVIREWNSKYGYSDYTYDENMCLIRADNFTKDGVQISVHHVTYADGEDGTTVAMLSGEPCGSYEGVVESQKWVYDASGNLIRKITIHPNGEEEIVLEQEFDNNGHITSHTIGEYKTVFTYDGNLMVNKQRMYPNGAVWYNYDCTYDEKGDLIALHTDEYSEEGNLKWYQDNTFEWVVYMNAEVEEITQKVIDGHSFVPQTITNEYHSDGSLVKKTVKWGTMNDLSYMTVYMPFDVYLAMR